MAANRPISVVLRRKKKAMSKRRRLKSALKAVLNYMKSDSYMFAPFIHQIQPSPPPPLSNYGGEVTIEEAATKKEEEKKEVNDYLKCDAYMYAPLLMDSGTTLPSSESGRVCNSVKRKVVMEESERIEHLVLHRRSPLSSKGKVLTHA